MAWNEPGNNGKNNDPWNQGGRNQGPPDMDEVFRNLSKKLGGIFGGGSGGASSAGGGGSSAIVTLVLVLALLGWLASGIYTIKESERGVVLRLGQYHGEVNPGINWKPTFIDQVLPVDVSSVETLKTDGFMLTQDQNLVRVTFEVQYRIEDPRAYKFAVVDPDSSLMQATDAALRYVVGHSLMDDVLTKGRELIRQNTRVELDAIIKPYNLGLQIVDVNFRDARPPEEVKASFDDAIAAQEDEQRFIREAEAYAREIEPRASGQVYRMEQEAKAYKQQVLLKAQGEVARFQKLLPEYLAAPEVTRKRLYIETMEQVYANTSKVLVDVKNGNNMMYIPLDKMINQSNSGAAPQPQAVDPRLQLPDARQQDVRPTTPRSDSGRTGRG
ncbi:FtsH protease activity modulator HflK [Rheinheimera sp. F8]|uniref:FtsH protease activity modulator HflK n=1 Tax=Rheinheimera sp. F8 TaxID=1763998 RepID=UPI000744B8E2|nr:FtsH protease activity modulator HflK [Rheinheimera sp. F8]ALZ76030.1 membrane protease HflK [Rheinheimera sp. F8]